MLGRRYFFHGPDQKRFFDYFKKQRLMFELLKRQLVLDSFLFVGYSFKDDLVLKCSAGNQGNLSGARKAALSVFSGGPIERGYLSGTVQAI